MKEIPTSIRIDTGNQTKIQGTIDDFFKETAEFIETNYLIEPNSLSIRTGGIAYDSMEPILTDNRVTYLIYKQKVIAIVMETRTEFNYVQFDFFRNLNGLEELATKENK